MDIGVLLKFINEEPPNHARELWSAVDLLSRTIENTRCAIDGTIGKLASDKNFDKAQEYMNMSQQLASVIDEVNKYVKKYALEDSVKNETIEEKERDNQNIINKINYEKYRVDENVAYSIYTDFTYKKPAAFSINGKKYSARKWQDLFMKTCEILTEINPEKFRLFTDEDTIQGRTRKYFSFDDKDIKKPKKVKGTEVFVETNLSANSIRNIIINMLERYNIPKSQYQIYLSKDLSALHKDDNSTERKSENAEDIDKNYHIQEDRENKVVQIENKKNVEAKNNVYQNNPMDFRFSKEVSGSQAMPQYNNLNQRMGTASHVEYLKMPEGDKRRHKRRCIEYDKKKELCMCVKSPYFIMKCGGASHCKYYSEQSKEEKYEVYARNTIKNSENKLEVGYKDSIYIISAQVQKQRKCTKCQEKTERKMIPVEYNHDGKMIVNKLPIYECQSCGRKHLLNTLYESYTNKKVVVDINFKFIYLDN